MVHLVERAGTLMCPGRLSTWSWLIKHLRVIVVNTLKIFTSTTLVRIHWTDLARDAAHVCGMFGQLRWSLFGRWTVMGTVLIVVIVVLFSTFTA